MHTTKTVGDTGYASIPISSVEEEKEAAVTRDRDEHDLVQHHQRQTLSIPSVSLWQVVVVTTAILLMQLAEWEINIQVLTILRPQPNIPVFLNVGIFLFGTCLHVISSYSVGRFTRRWSGILGIILGNLLYSAWQGYQAWTRMQIAHLDMHWLVYVWHHAPPLITAIVTQGVIVWLVSRRYRKPV